MSYICPGLALCGALSIYTDKETVAILQPTCLINCADELPNTPLPDTVQTYHKISVTDTPVTDLRPHMDTVADLIHQVIYYRIINYYVSLLFREKYFIKHDYGQNISCLIVQ